MKAKVLLTPKEAQENKFVGKNAIVIDVLRATTTICYAIYNGAKSIIPTIEIKEAFNLRDSIGDGVLLCGERDGKKIDGFDLGNSPREFTPEKIKDKMLICCTMNGTRAIIRARNAELVIIASIVNISFVAKTLLNDNKDIIIACSGKDGRFSLEDALCAGKLLSLLENKIELDNDGALTAYLIHQYYKDNLTKALKDAEHGKYLMSLGLEEDIKLCSTADTLKVLPILYEGKIINM